MSQETIIANTEVSFKDFLLKNKRNRTILWIAAVAIVIQFAVFKYLYPFASYIHGDSFSYLDAAFLNRRISTYMIGYSKFLRLISVFTDFDTALVAFQYIFLEINAIFLLFIIFYFYTPSKLAQIILIVFITLNPLFLYLSNYVSSDALFLSLSFLLFSLLLITIHKPTNLAIILQVLTLLIVFTIRYNALIYPFIVVATFLISNISRRKKIIGICANLSVCTCFILFTGQEYKKMGVPWQYSPFSGWQLANNAMYAYRDVSTRVPVPARFAMLDKIVREYYDSTRNVARHPQELLVASTFYMWDPRSPLSIYMNTVHKRDTMYSSLKKWASMGPLYSSYGIFIIKTYPLQFLKSFIWPNTFKYFAPPIEFLEKYNMGRDSVAPVAKMWFRYKTNKVITRTKTFDVTMLNFYPTLSGLSNILFISCLAGCFLLGDFNRNNNLSKGTLIFALVWISNAIFTIFGSSAALRFQSFPILLTTIFSLILFDRLFQILQREHEKNKILTPIDDKKVKPETSYVSL